MGASRIDISFLEELNATQEGQAVRFRLPSMPELPRNYSGATFTPYGLLAIFNQAIGLLDMAENDQFAADNEATMSKSRLLPSGRRDHHLRREKVLREQSERRQILSYAMFIAVTDAQFV
ncbi:MAG: hypothetical protein EON60_12295 [Alphaproteobacteria bacterium]|nr:MAG: hypothetical protein EON60_12295 [Alphaproteobacteria bacterium]